MRSARGVVSVHKDFLCPPWGVVARRRLNVPPALLYPKQTSEWEPRGVREPRGCTGYKGAGGALLRLRATTSQGGMGIENGAPR